MSLARSLRQRFRSDNKNDGQEDSRQCALTEEVIHNYGNDYKLMILDSHEKCEYVMIRVRPASGPIRKKCKVADV